ncbi:hypothetical protein ACJ72_02741 [Emergomyces africanus]|uniref:Uncharacterized protein n=1 Tax=Emergomyces africanus TaxID=1955775 RepID=A0A1B7P1J1_9EURO|nr:hypothetical protein ACJ72_02741 [Emergomyces africanus]
MGPKVNTDISTRAVIVALKSFGGKSTKEISEFTNLPAQTINRIYKSAQERGFNPNLPNLVICDDWLKDAPRSGRPRKQPMVQEDGLAKAHCDQYERDKEKSCAQEAGELSQTDFNDVLNASSGLWRIGKMLYDPMKRPLFFVVEAIESGEPRLKSLIEAGSGNDERAHLSLFFENFFYLEKESPGWFDTWELTKTHSAVTVS